MLLVGLGFNDMGWFVSGPDGTLASMKTLVDEARAANPAVKFALANVPQRTFIGGRDDLPVNTDAYNGMLARAIPTWSTARSPVALVDWRGNYSCETGGCPAGYDGLHPNALGEYQIAQAFERTLHDSYGLGASVPAVPAQIPARPTPAAYPINAETVPGGIKVTWIPVFGALGYDVRSRLQGQSTWTESHVGTNGKYTTWTSNGQVWEYQVRTNNGDNLKSDVDVSWGAATGAYTDTIDRYELIVWDRDTPGAFIGGTAVKSRSVHFDGLIPGHRYDVWVATWNAAGGGLPGGARPVTIGAGTPPAPSNLSVVSTDPTTVQLSWSGSSVAAGYRVWVRNVNNGSQATADENIIRGTTNGITYLCVTAVNGTAESGKSNCVLAPRPAGS
ncbi:hypothetical protein Adu01nite_91390 [Paractinoplanes durhamensis]|uniref:Fibronectin type-III domain-containing protein n=2 Tax=Paractinoplanes durhamensis TaxID=113563 RepID=A0ABQ3ZD96_9ACTN|nr:hypothetical protein Adu01nite_91390 [Actinoplanes durhamensis]